MREKFRIKFQQNITSKFKRNAQPHREISNFDHTSYGEELFFHIYIHPRRLARAEKKGKGIYIQKSEIYYINCEDLIAKIEY